MRYPRVTDIINVLKKPGLEFWYRNNSAEFCKAESEKSKMIGGLIHQSIQKHIEKEKIEFETEYPDEVSNAIKGFFKFKKDHPEFSLRKAEIPISSEKYGYCGTLDCLATEKKENLIFDFKTSKAKGKDNIEVYPEYIYQVSAYVYAYNEMMKRNISRASILCLAKDEIKYSFLIVSEQSIRSAFEEVFLPCLSIWKYQANLQGRNYARYSRQRSNGNSKGGWRYNKPGPKLPNNF